MSYIMQKALAEVISGALNIVEKNRNQFLTPEHLLISIFENADVVRGCHSACIDNAAIVNELASAVDKMEKVSADKYDAMIFDSEFSIQLITNAARYAEKKKRTTDDKNMYIITISDVLMSVGKLKDSWAKNIFNSYINYAQLITLINYIDENIKNDLNPDGETYIEDDLTHEDAEMMLNYEEMPVFESYEEMLKKDKNAAKIKNECKPEKHDARQNASEEETSTALSLPCISDKADSHAPVIGRDEETDLTIQCLCRRDRHNPLHIGEPGVGKTALIYKLARRINSGDVPECLRGSKIYSVDANALMAGTRYRGELELRVMSIMKKVADTSNAILYLDNIHNIMGAGKNADGAPSVADMLMPYLDDNRIRIIGSTTYQDYKKNMERNSALMRRFKLIDIKEPSEEEATAILQGLKKVYEKHHGVHYTDKAIEQAVTGSKKLITGRFLPDKAIDIIDEAGAYRVMHPLSQKRQTVNDELIMQMIYRACKLDAKAITEKDNKEVGTLFERISNKIFGQEQAVRQAVEAVEIARAGLGDSQKPIASMLFVGSTGVGKTELARVIAQEMNIGLVRFDMSEYTEKHTVAKLIGSPAGYVGYEEGGLLTDAIRKSPNCVLLLDEIEKAHQDIYNILLQIMDYGTLTDSHGVKADFKNVIIIMTSNAGAQYASQASIGFASNVTAGSAMVKEVKRLFKPEFINRLSCITMFNDMTRDMARMIMEKKLSLLADKLAAQNITMMLSDDAREHIMHMGFSQKYGAREMERTITRELTPLLTHEILYGKLKKGGTITFGAAEGKITILKITAR